MKLGGIKRNMAVQTRNHSGELKFFQTVKEAFDYAEENSSVWKVSFDETRFVRVETVDGKWAWAYQPMDKIVESAIEEATKQLSYIERYYLSRR